MTLDARRSTIHFINEAIYFEIVAKTAPIDGSANIPAVDDALLNDLTVNGKYQGVPFIGAARIGTFMSFRDSLEWFPLRGHLSAGKTRLDIDGKLADIFDLGPGTCADPSRRRLAGARSSLSGIQAAAHACVPARGQTPAGERQVRVHAA